MLEEAVAVIRLLWEGGVQSHRGTHYRVDHARIYDLPAAARRRSSSRASGPSRSRSPRGSATGSRRPSRTAKRSSGSAARPRTAARSSSRAARRSAGARMKRRAARPRTGCGRTRALAGELAQILPTPAHFEQACELVTEEMVADAVPCGPDLERQIESFERYAEAGFDELYVQQIGGADERFFEVYADEVLPRFHRRDAARDGIPPPEVRAPPETQGGDSDGHREAARGRAHATSRRRRAPRRSKQTLKHLPAETRTALGQEASKPSAAVTHRRARSLTSRRAASISAGARRWARTELRARDRVAPARRR